MRRAGMRLLVVLAGATFAACEPLAGPLVPPVPPFPESEFGAGIAIDAEGALVRFVEGDRADGALRMTARSARVYGPQGVRLGRVRAASGGGFVLERRDGTDVCTLDLGLREAAMRCQPQQWQVAIAADTGSTSLHGPDGQIWAIEGDADAARAQLASGVAVEVERSGARFDIRSGRWRRSALDASGALDARSLALRELVRSVDGAESELIAAGVVWMHERLRRNGPEDRSAGGAAATGGGGGASGPAQNAPPSSPAAGTGSSAAPGAGSAPDPGR